MKNKLIFMFEKTHIDSYVKFCADSPKNKEKFFFENLTRKFGV
jgi:hypothetical protein